MLMIILARASTSAASSGYVLAADLETDKAALPHPEVSAENGGEMIPAAIPPTWIINAGFITLARGQIDAATTAAPAFVIYNSGLQTVFNSATAERGGATGPDISLSRSLGQYWDVESRYFQVDGWNVNYVLHDSGGLLALGYDGYGIAETFSLTDTTRLYNIEVNFRSRHFERCPLIVGFRTMQLHERFQVAGFDPQYFLGPETQTNNFLWGGQIGAEPILWRPSDKFQLEGLVKTGIYGGFSSQQTVCPSWSSSFRDSQSSVPFVAELGLSGKWTFAKHWSCCIGFDLMWITNMALAIDQSRTISCGPPVTGNIYNKATALFTGFTGNIECRF
jgi:hypothetical protein